jgi:hypothetical protein
MAAAVAPLNGGAGLRSRSACASNKRISQGCPHLVRNERQHHQGEQPRIFRKRASGVVVVVAAASSSSSPSASPPDAAEVTLTLLERKRLLVRLCAGTDRGKSASAETAAAIGAQVPNHKP